VAGIGLSLQLGTVAWNDGTNLTITQIFVYYTYSRTQLYFT